MKPRIRYVPHYHQWACWTPENIGWGLSPKVAYDEWLIKLLGVKT